MKLFLLNTSEGLKPCYDEDYDNKKRLKLGETYQADIKLARNVDFHRKYFKLINLAWEYQDERMQKHFNDNKESFRKSVQIAAGRYEPIYNIHKKEWEQNATSIAFDKMDQLEFDEFYERVKDVLFQIFLTHIKEEEFMRFLDF